MVVELFLDTPDLKAYERHKNVISGGTTNPSLMSKMGIPPEQYKSHCEKILNILKDGVLSVEVTDVIPYRMYEEAKKFRQWGDNRIVVKIPSPFYLDESLFQRVQPVDFEQLCAPLNRVERKEGRVYVDTLPVIQTLAQDGVSLNVTCGFSYEQAHDIAATIQKATKVSKQASQRNYFSIFWGRLLDGYVANKSLGISDAYSPKDMDKITELSTAEVAEASRQLEGSGMRIILGSSRMPKVWEEAAKKDEAQLQHLRREAYRAVLRIAQPYNAIPTVPPALIEASRYHKGTAAAVKGFVEDFLKLRDS